MTFGAAINLLNKGKMVQRSGWNGNGLFVFKQVPAEISIDTVLNMQSLPDSVKQEFQYRKDSNASKAVEVEEFNSIRYNNQLALVSPTNVITGWSPSTSDALATDWMEYF